MNNDNHNNYLLLICNIQLLCACVCARWLKAMLVISYQVICALQCAIHYSTSMFQLQFLVFAVFLPVFSC
jgi:hypothetical protein